MVELGLALPAGHTLASLAERPDLRRPMNRFTSALWPEYMNNDPVAERLWHHLPEDYPGFQLALLDPAGDIVAVQHAGPLAWDGTDEGLPAGWDAQLEQTAADLLAGRAATALGALEIAVARERRGEGLAGLMLELMRANARAHGLRAVIACVRPTEKERYPLVPIDRYARWTRPDGLPFDAWMRLHARLGGRIARAEPRSMVITADVATWEGWTGMAFPESGTYWIPGGTSPLTIDREADMGTHLDENVWMVHDLA